VAQDQPTRREVLKGTVYMTPAILTLAAVPAFASSGSGRERPHEHSRSHRHNGSHEQSRWHEPGRAPEHDRRRTH
jgi:hypothetical protein